MMGKVRWIGATIGITLCLTMVHGHTPDDSLNQPITYDQPAQTVKQLLNTLSRQTGVRLFAPSPIDSEIVLVLVREMPLKELMKHLAEVTDGEWFKQPDGSYHLVRSPKVVRERRAQDDAVILQGLERALEEKEVKALLEPLTEGQAHQNRDKIKEIVRETLSQDLNTNLVETPYYWSLRESMEARGTPKTRRASLGNNCPAEGACGVERAFSAVYRSASCDEPSGGADVSA